MASLWVKTLRLAATANILLLAHTLVNSRKLREPLESVRRIEGTSTYEYVFSERISVLIPARNEATNITALLETLIAQVGCPNLEILVADDASTDQTASLVKQFASTTLSSITLIELADDLPPGWLGKSRTCNELAMRARGDVLVFVDADVRLAPDALLASCSLLRQANLDLLSPYPKQITNTLLARLTQPLLQWSWLAFLPLRLSENPITPASLSAANGQFLICDAGAYQQAGGHAAVAGEVIEDVGLARAFKKAGLKVGMANGTQIATCLMYPNDQDLIEGYSKSLWRAFGSPVGAGFTALLFAGLFIVPPIAVLTGGAKARSAGLVGYLAAVGQRAISAARTGTPVWPDSFGQPISIGILIGLIARSIRGHHAQQLTWRGRKV